jgi:hypothetical protein
MIHADGWSAECSGDVTLELDASGDATGSFVCGGEVGECEATFWDSYALSEDLANATVRCRGWEESAWTDMGGQLWLWGDSNWIGGTWSASGGAIASAGASFDAYLQSR